MPFLLLSTLFALLFREALASFRVVTAGDAAVTEIDHQLALFGRPTYGSGLVAALALAPEADRDACHPLDPLTLQSALASCGITTSHGHDGEETEPFVLLVKRGNCHFVEKARHAQAAGAAALVVYDSGGDGPELSVLTDDGTGGDIHIPSLLIHYKDARPLIAQLNNHVKTTVVIQWDVPHPDDRVEFSLWFSSRSSPRLHAFIENFRQVVRALGESVLFTPHYDVHLASAWGCNGDAARPTHCPDLCAFDEQFCTYDPEKNNTIGLDGKDVLQENVRQLCLYEHVQATTNSSVLFWEYLARFNANCSVPEATATQFNRLCSETVQNALGIPESVDACAKNQTSATRLLQKQIDALREFHVMEFPELTVNGIPMFGSVTCDAPISLATCAPLHMICAGFVDGHLPEACNDAYWTAAASCVAPLEIDDCGVCSLRGSPLWNFHCAGCDDVPHSGKRFDLCGVCGGDGSFDLCGQCLPAKDARRDTSCLDCKGVPHGLTQRDACGVCNGHGSFDICGLCLDANDPRRQNIVCHVMEDPDAVTGKAEIRGVDRKQFHGNVVTSFQEAVAFLSDMRPDQVLIKAVDNAVSEKPTVVVLFFVACETEICRANVTKKLQDLSPAAHVIAMKMKSLLDDKAYGLELSKLIEHVALHSVNSGLNVSLSSAFATIPEEAHEPHAWLSIVIACAMTLTVGVVLLRARDDRIRRDFRELFAQYTPSTALEHEDEHELLCHLTASADTR